LRLSCSTHTSRTCHDKTLPIARARQTKKPAALTLIIISRASRNLQQGIHERCTTEMKDPHTSEIPINHSTSLPLSFLTPLPLRDTPCFCARRADLNVVGRLAAAALPALGPRQTSSESWRVDTVTCNNMVARLGTGLARWRAYGNIRSGGRLWRCLRTELNDGVIA
jgi:hypothetical protein